MKWIPLKNVKGVLGLFTGSVDEINPYVFKKVSDNTFSFRMDGIEYREVTVQVTPRITGNKSYVQFMITDELNETAKITLRK